MLEDEKKRKKALEVLGEDEEGGESGSQGGKSGSLEFREFLFIGEEKKLSPEEERQLLAVHKETNSQLIEKQKKLRDQRKEKKEGKTVAYGQTAGMEARSSAFLKHPILGEAAEFDGVDPQVNLDPTIYKAETNSEKQEELVYQHQLRLRLENQPRFNPKPSPF
jgi:hypothetical protein